MALSDLAFDTNMGRLVDAFHPGIERSRFAGVIDEYARRFQHSERITDAVFTEAVTEAIDHFPKRNGIPGVADMAQVIDAVLPDFERQAAPRALLPPPVNVMAVVDHTDPYACTPEERQRWAREDAELRKLPPHRPTPPELMARLSQEDRESCLAFDLTAHAVRSIPTLKPIERRAREQRAAVAREQMRPLMAAAAARQREYAAAVQQQRDAYVPANSVVQDTSPDAVRALLRARRLEQETAEAGVPAAPPAAAPVAAPHKDDWRDFLKAATAGEWPEATA